MFILIFQLWDFIILRFKENETFEFFVVGLGRLDGTLYSLFIACLCSNFPMTSQ